jgi:hypothetical protein
MGGALSSGTSAGSRLGDPERVDDRAERIREFKLAPSFPDLDTVDARSVMSYAAP